VGLVLLFCAKMIEVLLFGKKIIFRTLKF
jgi:hypothetical protein